MAIESTATGPAAEAAADLISAARRQAVIDVFGEKFATTYQGPISFMHGQVISSPVAINFFKRDFGFLSKFLGYEYQYRSWHGFDQDLLDRYAEIISKKLASMNMLLENSCNRLTKLMEQNGIEMESTLYQNPLRVIVPITSGFARQYFAILNRLDQLNLLAGTANLMGVIDSTQRANAEFTAKKAVRAFAAALRNEVVRIYREAARMNSEAHGNGSATTGQTATVEAQGQELTAFAKSIDDEGKTDSALDLRGTDPSKVLDDAVASSTAAAKSATRPRKPPAEKSDAAPDTQPAAATA